MRVLQISADRSARGVLYPGSPAFARQEAYARQFGGLDIIGFSRKSDGAQRINSGPLRIFPTDSRSRFTYVFQAIRVAKTLPKPDVVTAQDPFETGLAAYFIARHFRVPLHVQVHTDFLSPEYARHSLLNRLRVFLAGFVLRRAIGVRVVSQRIKESIGATYRLNVPISALPIFADVVGIHQRQPDSALVRAFDRFDAKILFVGRLEPEKNPRLAIRAFAETAPERTCLIIVGNGSEYQALRHLVRELDISDRVFFETEAESAKYYPIEDLVIVTSHYEGYGLVIIEALAAGKPVLSTDVGIAREAGAIIAPPEKFAEALAQWFAHGPREGHLKNYPYRNLEDYVRKYSDDIRACAESQKTA